MELTSIQSQKEWNALVAGTPLVPFVQSWEWGEFQKAQGHTVFRLGIKSENKIIIGAQWIKLTLPFGLSYFYAPYGPVTTIVPSSQNFQSSYKTYLRAVQTEYGKNIFLRFEPRVELCYESHFVVLKSDLQLQRTHARQVRDTRVLVLSKNENELLADMHQKTRYNIRLAEKKGVVIKNEKKYIEDFVRLNHETTTRDNFKSHDDEYYTQMAKYLPDEMMTVYVAEHEGKTIAANIVITFGDTTTYVHGASSSENRNVMAPYLLQWEQIKDAKRRGSHCYDFWGIAPEKRTSNKKKAWAGITRFKNGFGGKEKNFTGAFDLPIHSFWYSLYNVVRRSR